MAREVPQYISQLSIGSLPKIQMSMAGAEATTRASAQLGAIAEDMNQKAAEMEELEVKTTASEAYNRIYNESPNDPYMIKAKIDGFNKEFIPSIGNSTLRERMRITANLDAMPYIDKATAGHRKIIDQQHELIEERAMAQAKINMGNAVTVLSNPESTPEQLESAQGYLSQNWEEFNKILSSTNSDGTFRRTPQKQQSEYESIPKIVLDNVPLEQKPMVLGDIKGDKAEAIAFTHKYEGGLNPSDGNTGQPTLFGISKKWHKDAYNKVKAVFDTGNTAAAQKMADDYLIATFWDANNLDALAPNQRGIVYDGLINGAPKALLQRAREGAKPSELIRIRQDYYDALAAQKDPKTGAPIHSKEDVASWNRRLAAYRPMALGEYADMLPEDERQKYRKEIATQFKQQEETAYNTRIMEKAASNRAIYDRFVNNSPNILQEIEDFRVKGGDPELAAYMRQSALSRNKMPEAEQDSIYADLFGRTQDAITKLNENEDSVSLEDLARLQDEMMREDLRGVKGLSPQIKRITNAMLIKAGKETGYDDPGLFDGSEPLDDGYEAIQRYLVKQNKESDNALKTKLIRGFISKADQLPDEIKNDKVLFKEAQKALVNEVIAGTLVKTFPGIPPAATANLLKDPASAAQFDAKYGVGKAAKILGGAR